VVEEDGLEGFFGGFLAVLGDLFESFVGRSKDSVVCFGAVEELN
jgi:hypothetical protein